SQACATRTGVQAVNQPNAPVPRGRRRALATMEPSSPPSPPREGVAMELKNIRAAVLVEQQYQEMEVWYPVYRLREAGCKVTLVGPEAGQTYPSKLGYPAKSDKAARDVSAEDFDVLVIPGGFAPDFLRRCEPVIRLTSTLAEQG